MLKRKMSKKDMSPKIKKIYGKQKESDVETMEIRFHPESKPTIKSFRACLVSSVVVTSDPALV